MTKGLYLVMHRACTECYFCVSLAFKKNLGISKRASVAAFPPTSTRGPYYRSPKFSHFILSRYRAARDPRQPRSAFAFRLAVGQRPRPRPHTTNVNSRVSRTKSHENSRIVCFAPRVVVVHFFFVYTFSSRVL